MSIRRYYSLLTHLKRSFNHSLFHNDHRADLLPIERIEIDWYLDLISSSSRVQTLDIKYAEALNHHVAVRP